MKVLVLMTWEVPKSEEGLKAWREANVQYYHDRLVEHNVKTSSWTEGTGKTYYMMEFESYDAYGKFMDDEELHRDFARRCRLINNAEIKVLREFL